jgi:invasion protein IalB
MDILAIFAGRRARDQLSAARRVAACALLPIVLALPAGAAATDQKQEKPAAPAAAASPAPLLPGGASALSETYGSWTVNCQAANNVKSCSMAHQQVNKNNNQRVLAMEIFAKSTDEGAGTIALPFGLAVSKGVTLTVDDQKPSPVLPFSTCLSAGCLVPVTMDHKLLQELGAGKTLKIVGTVFDTQQPITFSVPLASFGAALARTASLSAN